MLRPTPKILAAVLICLAAAVDMAAADPEPAGVRQQLHRPPQRVT